MKFKTKFQQTLANICIVSVLVGFVSALIHPLLGWSDIFTWKLIGLSWLVCLASYAWLGFLIFSPTPLTSEPTEV